MSSVRSTRPAAVERSAIRPRNLDVLKWVGAVAMLVDHFWLYVFGATYWSEAAGSLALPLFALALAEGIAQQHRASRLRTLARLVVGALVAQLALLLVRGPEPLNVIFTLAGAVALDSVWRFDFSKLQRAAIVAAVFAIGLHVEYGHVGVLFGFFVCRWSFTRGDLWFAASLVGCALLAPFNGNHFALAAIAVAAVVSLFPKDSPRARNAFYYVYILQWPAIAAAVALLKTA